MNGDGYIFLPLGNVVDGESCALSMVLDTFNLFHQNHCVFPEREKDFKVGEDLPTLLSCRRTHYLCSLSLQPSWSGEAGVPLIGQRFHMSLLFNEEKWLSECLHSQKILYLR